MLSQKILQFDVISMGIIIFMKLEILWQSTTVIYLWLLMSCHNWDHYGSCSLRIQLQENLQGTSAFNELTETK